MNEGGTGSPSLNPHLPTGLSEQYLCTGRKRLTQEFTMDTRYGRFIGIVMFWSKALDVPPSGVPP